MTRNNSIGLTRRENIKLVIKDLEYRRIPAPIRTSLVKSLSNPFDRSCKIQSGREVCFIHVPKTGGTSIASCLGIKPGHIPLSRYYAWSPERLKASFTFAFVRSPWSRTFSSYNYLKSAIGLNHSPDVRWATENLGRYSTFEEFVVALKDQSTRRRIFLWPHFRSQIQWLTVPGEGIGNLDFLGRYECLSQEVDRLALELDFDFSLPHLRRANSYSERPVFTQEMIEVIGDVYADDVAAFGYEPPD